MKRFWMLGVAVVLVVAAGLGMDGRQEGAEFLKDPGSLQLIHEHFSTWCFNECWKLIDKASRSPDDLENMISLSYTSLWHWKQRKDVKPVNLSVGYWQLSRVHALAGQYEMARRHGEKCLEISEKNVLSPFYLGYAHEALARAEVLHKEFGKARIHLTAAERELAKVTDDEEKKLLAADLAQLKGTIPNP